MGNLQLRRVWKAGEEREEPILGALRDVAAIETVKVSSLALAGYLL